ncbi:MAG TPA: hypothetical protein VGW40_01150 [Allosphingosinicella sp.]|nr:hypothetical protein [Allosphingosinicella sp.]
MAKQGTRGAAAQTSEPQDKVTAFLVGLATDPAKLGRFIQSPDSELEAAGIDQADRAILKSGNPAAIHARIGGQPAPPRPDPMFMLVSMSDDGQGGSRPSVAQNILPMIFAAQQPVWPPMIFAAQSAPMMLPFSSPSAWPMPMMPPFPWPMMSPFPSPMPMMPPGQPMFPNATMFPPMMTMNHPHSTPSMVHPMMAHAALAASPPMMSPFPSPTMSPIMSPAMPHMMPMMMSPVMQSPFPMMMPSPFPTMPSMMMPSMMMPSMLMPPSPFPQMPSPFPMDAPMRMAPQATPGASG